MDQLLPVSPEALGLGWWYPRHWREIRRSDPIEQSCSGPEPVSLDLARAQLRLDGHDQDQWLQAAIPAVRRQVEADLGLTLVQTVFVMIFDQFPIDRWFEIRGQVVSVGCVSSFAIDNSETTFAPSNYFADTFSTPGRVILTVGSVWPTGLRPFMAGKVVWTAKASKVSPRWVQAMLLLLAHWYENREAVTTGIMRYVPTVLPLGYNECLTDRVSAMG